MRSSSEVSMSIDVSDAIEVLSRLQLPIISDCYVEKVTNSQYTYYTFPETYESIVMPDIDFPSIINESCELLNMYLQPSSGHINWDQFVSDDTCYINPKTLSCLLNCYIQNGIKDMQEFIIRKNALTAIRLFFLASTFKDSKNIGFYHFNILTKCLELIKSCVMLLHNTGSMFNSDIQLNEDEKNDLMTDLLSIIRDLRVMVKRFKLFDEIGTIDLIVDIMIDVTRLERTSGNILEQTPTERLSFSTLAFNAYSVLMDMFNDNCGSTFDIGQKLMYCIMPGLLVDAQREMHLSTKQFNVIRDHHLSFIRKLTKKLGVSFECLLEILLQNLLFRGPDRSELKQRQLQIILEVWRLCPNNVRIKIKFFFFRLVYTIDSKIRIFALEVLFKLLSEPEEIEPDDPQLLSLMPATKHEFIVAVILSKFQDPLLTVRAKAISLFGTLTATPPTSTAYQHTLAKRVLVDPYLNVESLDQTLFCQRDFIDFHQYAENNMKNFDPINISNSQIYPGVKTILWVLNVHARDERAYIRRLSLTLLCNLLLINKKLMERYYLSLLQISCSDCTMTIRKVVVSGLTDLILKYPDNQNVLKYWFNSLIHLVGDRDKRIQELTVECMDRVILKNIKPYSTKLTDNNDPLDYLPWLVLDNVFNENVGLYMQCLCEKWHNYGFLTDKLIKDIMTYVDLPNHDWNLHSLYLLQLISQQMTITDLSSFIKYTDRHCDTWFSEEALSDQNNLLTCAQMIIDILFLNYTRLGKKRSQQLFDKIESLLFNFKVPVRLISKSLDLYTVLQSDNPDKQNTNLKNLFQITSKSIETFKNSNNDTIRIVNQIYTLGDVGLVQNLKIKHTFHQYLLDMLNIKNNNISQGIKAILILTIGKLSIVDEQLAKEAITSFGKILKDTSCHSSLKINALTALADLCLRCTTLVEQAIPEMCVCLKDNSLSVKRVALKLLTGLILEDYIKLRDVAFFALLCMLEDSDCHVRQETSSFIVNYLLIKNKNIMERKLIEVIFHFNGYTGGRYSGIKNCFTTSELKAFFSMEGDSKKVSRHCVYKFMLTHMFDDSKLKLMVKIFNIFEQIVNDVNETKYDDVIECAIQVMKDAFWILKAKEMALTSGKPRDSNNDDDPGTLEKVTDIAKNEVVINTYKMVMADYIIPSVIKLKDELQKSKKGLATVMNDLRSYLSVLTSGKSPIKNEIVKLLSDNGEELISEILLDNKQMKQHKQKIENDTNLDSEDDDEDYRPIHFIEELQFATWAQLMEIHDRVEEPNLDKSRQSQMQKELENNLSRISIAENNVQDVPTTITSQQIDEEIQPIKRGKKKSSTGKCKRLKMIGNNKNTQFDNSQRLSNGNSLVNKTKDDDVSDDKFELLQITKNNKKSPLDSHQQNPTKDDGNFNEKCKQLIINENNDEAQQGSSQVSSRKSPVNKTEDEDDLPGYTFFT
ncbi:Armadillo-type fold,Condensin complex subunit 1, C-terminal,Armadillo-like helical [Cinara cedri]|uniref:Armadillo-type fold,Condensin complex subunit 1, C-terminal,Armadillo-like helical n=1 Tax=Cinara cedri TaxID=506608 RepID=A0A5E4N9B4_9HEMI|nr:Armadillo-type fold,Condensin complex subunit 1, C-terminal,Armadillo-like helical [Cinara cedri]